MRKSCICDDGLCRWYYASGDNCYAPDYSRADGSDLGVHHPNPQKDSAGKCLWVDYGRDENGKREADK